MSKEQGWMPGDVYFGGPDVPLPDWRAEASDSDADDDAPLSDEERKAMVRMLGFDPSEMFPDNPAQEPPRVPPSPFLKSLTGYLTKGIEEGKPCTPGHTESRDGCVPAVPEVEPSPFTEGGGHAAPTLPSGERFSGEVIHGDMVNRSLLEKELTRFLDDSEKYEELHDYDLENNPYFYITKVINSYLETKSIHRSGHEWRFAVEGKGSDARIVGGIHLSPFGPRKNGGMKLEDLGSIKSGAGKQLLTYSLQKAKENGKRTVSLESSRGAAGFYEKMGFKPTGVSPGEGSGEITHVLDLEEFHPGKGLDN